MKSCSPTYLYGIQQLIILTNAYVSLINFAQNTTLISSTTWPTNFTNFPATTTASHQEIEVATLTIEDNSINHIFTTITGIASTTLKPLISISTKDLHSSSIFNTFSNNFSTSITVSTAITSTRNILTTLSTVSSVITTSIKNVSKDVFSESASITFPTTLFVLPPFTQVLTNGFDTTESQSGSYGTAISGMAASTKTLTITTSISSIDVFPVTTLFSTSHAILSAIQPSTSKQSSTTKSITAIKNPSATLLTVVSSDDPNTAVNTPSNSLIRSSDAFSEPHFTIFLNVSADSISPTTSFKQSSTIMNSFNTESPLNTPATDISRGFTSSSENPSTIFEDSTIKTFITSTGSADASSEGTFAKSPFVLTSYSIQSSTTKITEHPSLLLSTILSREAASNEVKPSSISLISNADVSSESFLTRFSDVISDSISSTISFKQSSMTKNIVNTENLSSTAVTYTSNIFTNATNQTSSSNESNTVEVNTTKHPSTLSYSTASIEASIASSTELKITSTSTISRVDASSQATVSRFTVFTPLISPSIIPSKESSMMENISNTLTTPMTNASSASTDTTNETITASTRISDVYSESTSAGSTSLLTASSIQSSTIKIATIKHPSRLSFSTITSEAATTEVKLYLTSSSSIDYSFETTSARFPNLSTAATSPTTHLKESSITVNVGNTENLSTTTTTNASSMITNTTSEALVTSTRSADVSSEGISTRRLRSVSAYPSSPTTSENISNTELSIQLSINYPSTFVVTNASSLSMGATSVNFATSFSADASSETYSTRFTKVSADSIFPTTFFKQSSTMANILNTENLSSNAVTNTNANSLNFFTSTSNRDVSSEITSTSSTLALTSSSKQSNTIYGTAAKHLVTFSGTTIFNEVSSTEVKTPSISPFSNADAFSESYSTRFTSVSADSISPTTSFKQSSTMEIIVNTENPSSTAVIDTSSISTDATSITFANSTSGDVSSEYTSTSSAFALATSSNQSKYPITFSFSIASSEPSSTELQIPSTSPISYEDATSETFSTRFSKISPDSISPTTSFKQSSTMDNIFNTEDLSNTANTSPSIYTNATTGTFTTSTNSAHVSSRSISSSLTSVQKYYSIHSSTKYSYSYSTSSTKASTITSTDVKITSTSTNNSVDDSSQAGFKNVIVTSIFPSTISSTESMTENIVHTENLSTTVVTNTSSISTTTTSLTFVTLTSSADVSFESTSISSTFVLTISSKQSSTTDATATNSPITSSFLIALSEPLSTEIQIPSTFPISYEDATSETFSTRFPSIPSDSVSPTTSFKQSSTMGDIFNTENLSSTALTNTLSSIYTNASSGTLTTATNSAHVSSRSISTSLTSVQKYYSIHSRTKYSCSYSTACTEASTAFSTEVKITSTSIISSVDAFSETFFTRFSSISADSISPTTSFIRSSTMEIIVNTENLTSTAVKNPSSVSTNANSLTIATSTSYQDVSSEITFTTSTIALTSSSKQSITIDGTSTKYLVTSSRTTVFSEISSTEVKTPSTSPISNADASKTFSTRFSSVSADSISPTISFKGSSTMEIIVNTEDLSSAAVTYTLSVSTDASSLTFTNSTSGDFSIDSTSTSSIYLLTSSSKQSGTVEVNATKDTSTLLFSIASSKVSSTEGKITLISSINTVDASPESTVTRFSKVSATSPSPTLFSKESSLLTAMAITSSVALHTTSEAFTISTSSQFVSSESTSKSSTYILTSSSSTKMKTIEHPSILLFTTLSSKDAATEVKPPSISRISNADVSSEMFSSRFLNVSADSIFPTTSFKPSSTLENSVNTENPSSNPVTNTSTVFTKATDEIFTSFTSNQDVSYAINSASLTSVLTSSFEPSNTMESTIYPSAKSQDVISSTSSSNSSYMFTTSTGESSIVEGITRSTVPLTGVSAFPPATFKRLFTSVPPTVNGSWSEWSDWNSCTASCGVGLKSRIRSCTKPAPLNGGLNCDGELEESQTCLLPPCQIDGRWSLWSKWSACSATCNDGLSLRSRTCSEPFPQYGGYNCSGESSESKSCLIIGCLVNGSWSEWSDWNSCTASCGVGLKSRIRSCTKPAPLNGGMNCDGELEESQACLLPSCPIDGRWSEWSEWSACSATCNDGLSLRSRTCSEPFPRYGGHNCSGESSESKNCFITGCSGYYLSKIGQLSCTKLCKDLSLVCSPVVQTNNDTVIYNNLNVMCTLDESSSKWNKPFHPAYNPELKKCIGYKNVPIPVECNYESNSESNLQRICNCLNPADAGFGPWASWSPCSTSCGESFMARKRICFGVCDGKDLHTVKCPVDPCPIDGQWGNWTEFASCSQTCGSGYIERIRLCDSPPTQFGGMKCPGPSSNVINGCNPDPCPVHGGVSEWGQWGLCNEPCMINKSLASTAVSSRLRYCDNPAPAYRGNPCQEPLVEYRRCNLSLCQEIDMHYSIHFPDEEWNYKLFYANGKEGTKLFGQIQLQIMKQYNSSQFIAGIHLHFFTKGSVIVDLTISYNYINRDQVVTFIDAMRRKKALGDMGTDYFEWNSTTITCPAPVEILTDPLDGQTVKITWTRFPCRNGFVAYALYIYFHQLDENVQNISTFDWTTVAIPENYTEYDLSGLKPSSVYEAHLMVATNIGNGSPSKVFYIQTPIGPPSMKPQNVTATSTTPNDIYIEWIPIPKQYWNGPLLGYKIRYKIFDDEKVNMKLANADSFSNILSDLKAFTTYLITVTGYNEAGESDLEFSVTKTQEDVPSVAVPGVIINDMQAVDWWAVSWSPIPKDKINGVHLGYKLVYYLSFKSGLEVSGAVNKQTLYFDEFTFYFKATNMENFATYNVVVTAYTAAGDGPSPEHQASTCNCMENLYANWIVSSPYTKLVGNDNLTGIFTELVEELIIEACGSCQSYKKSVLHFFQSKTGEPSQKKNEYELKISISDIVDVSFPIYGRKDRKKVGPNSLFTQLISSPGCAMIVRDEAALAADVVKLILSVFNVWPLLIVSYSIAALFGVVIWGIDQFENPAEFNIGDSCRGPLVGFWFAFITMTTVGYGDITPRSVIGKSLSMVWFLIGLILNGIIIGFISTALTSFGLPEEVKLYNTKTAALNNSFEYRYAVLRNAKVDADKQYQNIPLMLNALESMEVDAVLVDTYSMTAYKEILEEKKQKVKALIQTNSGYGFVVSGLSQAIQPSIESMISGKQEAINNFIGSLEKKIPDLDLPEAGQATKDLFSGESDAFQSSVIWMVAMILSGTLIGIALNIHRYVKQRKLVHAKKSEVVLKYESLSKGVEELCEIIRTHHLHMFEVLENKEERDIKEILNLVKVKSTYQNKVERMGERNIDMLLTRSFGTNPRFIRVLPISKFLQPKNKLDVKKILNSVKSISEEEVGKFKSKVEEKAESNVEVLPQIKMSCDINPRLITVQSAPYSNVWCGGNVV